MKDKRVLTVLSCFNGEKYVEQQIDSIFAQCKVDVSCLARDDGSQDKTSEILKRCEEKYAGKFAYFHGENIGFAKSFYTLLRESEEYGYYAFSDQDDVWCEDKLYSCISMIEENDEVPSVCFCNCMLVDADLNSIGKMHDEPVDTSDKVRNLLVNPAPGCTMVFNKAAKEYFLRGNSENIEFHDHWLLTVCSYFGKVVYNPEVGVLYRQHGNNTVGGMQGKKISWKHRLKVLKQDTHDCERNAKELLANFGDRLSEEDTRIVSKIALYRKKFLGKLKLCMAKDIKAHLHNKKKWFVRRVLIGKL